MKILRNIFRKNAPPSSQQHIIDLTTKFVEASRLVIPQETLQSYENCQLYLIYMLGSVDALCQSHNLDAAVTISLYKDLLKGVLGGYSNEEADQVLEVTIKASETDEGQKFMIEGGESIRLWLNGASLASHRLNELLT